MTPPDDHDLVDPVRRRRWLRDLWKSEGERSLGQNIAMIGAYGWIIVTPTLIGLFLGRLIDRHFGTGIFWSASLLFLGVVIGMWLVWQKMHEP